MSDVAVVVREDTGVVVSSDGAGLSDGSKVRCDSTSRIEQVVNAYLIDVMRGAGHDFNGSDFEEGCAADGRHLVNVKFDINKKGERVAVFTYKLKRGQLSLGGDPFKCVVINGRKYCTFVPTTPRKMTKRRKKAEKLISNK